MASTAATEPVIEPTPATTTVEIQQPKIESTETAAVAEDVVPSTATDATTPAAAEATTAEEPDTTAPTATTNEEAPKASEEEAANEAPAKPSLTKRRTIFNPFAKSKKEEAPAATTEANKEAEPTTSTSTGSKEEEKAHKKTSKGFGTFFSRSKVCYVLTVCVSIQQLLMHVWFWQSTPKVSEEANAAATTAEETVVPTELPQIEQLQPIETEINVEDKEETKKEPTVKEAVAEVAEAAQAEVAEVAEEVEQAATQASATVANKRQSFISKLFGKKKQDTAATKEIEEETPAAVAFEATEEVVVEPATEEQPKEGKCLDGIACADTVC